MTHHSQKFVLADEIRFSICHKISRCGGDPKRNPEAVITPANWS